MFRLFQNVMILSAILSHLTLTTFLKLVNCIDYFDYSMVSFTSILL